MQQCHRGKVKVIMLLCSHLSNPNKCLGLRGQKENVQPLTERCGVLLQCGHREQEEPFFFIAWRWLFLSLSLTPAFDRHSRWPQWHEWIRKEVPLSLSPLLSLPPSPPHTHSDWQRWQAAPKIRPHRVSVSVPGQLLSYASVMVCSPWYLLISLWLWPVFTEVVCQCSFQEQAWAGVIF